EGGAPPEHLAEQLPIGSRKSGRNIADTRSPVIILLMRLAFMEVRTMVCLLQEKYQSFVSQSSPELTAPRLTEGTNVLVYQQPSLGEDAMRRLFLILSLLLPVTVLGSSASL